MYMSLAFDSNWNFIRFLYLDTYFYFEWFFIQISILTVSECGPTLNFILTKISYVFHMLFIYFGFTIKHYYSLKVSNVLYGIDSMKSNAWLYYFIYIFQFWLWLSLNVFLVRVNFICTLIFIVNMNHHMIVICKCYSWTVGLIEQKVTHDDTFRPNIWLLYVMIEEPNGLASL